MALRLNGQTSGYVELEAPATAGSNTLTLPNGNGSSGQYLQTNGSGGLSWQTVTDTTTNLTRSTSQTVSGTPVYIEFTGIPAGVRRITIMVDNLQGQATNRLLQLGSTTYTTTGYNTRTAYGTASHTDTTGFILGGGNSTGDPYYGSWVIENLTGNSWTFRGISHSNVVRSSSGEVTIGGELDQIRLAQGSGWWTAGTVNIMWET